MVAAMLGTSAPCRQTAGDTMASEPAYEVEKIVSRKITPTGRRKYLIRWKGFPPSADTWEPMIHLNSCQALVKSFDEMHDETDGVQHGKKKKDIAKKIKKLKKHLCTRQKKLSCSNSDDTDNIRYKLISRATKQNTKSDSFVAKNLQLKGKNVDSRRVTRNVGVTVSSKNNSNFPIERLAPKRLKLLDSIRKRDLKAAVPEIVKPMSAVMAYSAMEPQSLTSRGQSSTMSTVAVETYYGDVPGCHPSSMIPASPSTTSYKMLLSAVPRYSHSSKHQKDDTDSSEEENGIQIGRRLSVRQSECAFRYKEIVVKKLKGYTQIWLNTNTQLKNTLNPQVIQEIVAALNSAKYDDSHLVMFSSVGNTFCLGIDLYFLMHGDRKVMARQMADALREFTKAFITFPKPVVAVVSGPAVGIGMAMLPICDVVYASDKASFYLPYAQLGQTPECCSSYTFPLTVGVAMANELFLGRRKVTATEAYQWGLLSQVFWPTTLMQEVIPRVQTMVTSSAKAMETTKLLIRSHQRTKLELTNETECNLLFERWSSPEYQKSVHAYLSSERNFLM